MSDRIDQAMIGSVARTLENMAFMEVLPCEEEPLESTGSTDPAELTEPAESAEESEGTMAVDLLVHSPVQGEFRLVMGRSLAVKIAEAVFGQTLEELTDQILGDILSEILNTVAGLFMTAYLAGEQVFQLGLPELHMEGVEDAEPPIREWRLCMDNEVFFVKIWGDFS